MSLCIVPLQKLSTLAFSNLPEHSYEQNEISGNELGDGFFLIFT